MLHTREEEMRQAQRLHLLPDERDKAVQIKAKGKAGSVIALFSLLFCAACILQGSSTWTAFLSLAFIGFAAQNFHQFSCDRERFYLVLAAAASLLALLLGGWFLFENLGQTWASMGRLCLFIVLSALLTSAAGLLFVALFLLFAWIKGSSFHKDPEKWEHYFHSVSTLGFLLRLGILLTLSMAITAVVSYFIFSHLQFPTPERFALIYLLGGWLLLFQKFSQNRSKLTRKLLKLKNTSPE